MVRFFPLWDQMQCQIYMTGEKNAFSHYALKVSISLGVEITTDQSFTSVYFLFELQLRLIGLIPSTELQQTE